MTFFTNNNSEGQQDEWAEAREVLERQIRGFGGAWKWFAGIGAIIVLFIVANIAKGIYTELLWFGNLGYSSVYTTMLTTKIWLFLVGAAAFFVIVIANVILAQRLSPKVADISLLEAGLKVLRRVTNVLIYIGAVILSIIFGSIASGQWDAILRFFNKVSFGTMDPVFGRDVAFYVFTLPVYRFVQMWLMGALWLTIIATVVIYMIYFGLARFNFTFTPAIKGHLSGLGAVVFLLFGWGYYLDIFDLVYSPRGVVTGASFTDVHPQLLALRVLIAIAIVVAILLVINVFFRGVRLPLAGVGLWIAAAIILGNIYPNIVQNFQVKPNEFVMEKKYIEYNINSTRLAFGLGDIEEKNIPVEITLTEEQIKNNSDIVNNIRIWDYRPLRDTYNQIQSIRLYYDFLDPDVDRYTIDGEYRQVMLGARELSPEKLAAQAQTWVNQRLQFTHGYGVALSPVNEISPEGLPELWVKDVPPMGKIEIDRPEIYYGEKSTNYVIVNTAEGEFDYPKGDTNIYTKYQGKGGVQLSSFFRKFVYAWQMGDINILISGSLTPQSRVMYYRQIQDRVKHLAPFLRLDHDPYIVIADGKLFWIQDAYTTTDKYPYSAPFQEDFNYIRNSVKVVISAYDGTATFYVFDPEDPLIKTYQRIFPVLFKPMAEMPNSLKAHIRYPQDLFTVQSEMYRTYHMTDAKVFYNKEDLWMVPVETYAEAEQPMEPYYVIMRLAQDGEEEFLLMLPFTPSSKDNMIAWLAGRSDGENYGKLLVYNFPKDRLIYGPRQVEARINQDTTISRLLSLWGQMGSRVIRGNLLVIPIEDSIMYIEPLYIQAETGRLPELKRVIVAIGNQIAMEPSLQDSLDVIFGKRTPTTEIPGAAIEPAAPTITPTPAATPIPGKPATAAELAAAAQQHYERAQLFLKQGDWARYGEELKQLEDVLNQLVRATAQ